MRLEIDREVDCGYVHLQDEIVEGEACWNLDAMAPADLDADVVVDLDADGHLLGIEVIGASLLLSPLDIAPTEEISNSEHDTTVAVRRRWPVYLDAFSDVLRAPLGPNRWEAATRVLRLPLPEQVPGWIELHLDADSRLLRIDAGRAHEFFNQDVLAHAIPM